MVNQKNEKTYFKADILCLAAGTYSFKVEPVFSGGVGLATETENVMVKAHDRSGFAFSNNKFPALIRLIAHQRAMLLYCKLKKT